MYTPHVERNYSILAGVENLESMFHAMTLKTLACHRSSHSTRYADTGDEGDEPI